MGIKYKLVREAITISTKEEIILVDAYDINVERLRNEYLKKQDTTSNICRVTCTIVPYPILNILENKLGLIFAHPHFTIPNRVPQVMHTLLFWVGGKDSGTGENEEGFHEFFANW